MGGFERGGVGKVGGDGEVGERERWRVGGRTAGSSWAIGEQGLVVEEYCRWAGGYSACCNPRTGNTKDMNVRLKAI